MRGRCRRSRGTAAAPERRRDDPGVDFDALRVRLVDERLQRIEREWREAGLIGARHRRAVAETVAAPDDLRDDRIQVRGLRRGDDRVDARRIEQVVAERVDPVRAELAPRRSPGVELRGL